MLFLFTSLKSTMKLPFKMSSNVPMFLLLLVLPFSFTITSSEACLGGKLSLLSGSYKTSCPDAEAIIFSGVEQAVFEDPRMAASLLRLHFHDCFVNGCDASVLLDDTDSFVGEKTATPNVNSLRGFEVIDQIKAELELACPETVSCADLLAIAARDSVVLSGGPSWEVQIGRRDSLSANKDAANNNIPGPTSNVANLINKFQNVGLSPKDMVALSGSHTIGKARCTSFSSRLAGSLSSGDIDTGAGTANFDFLSSLQELCSGSDVDVDVNSTLAELDYATPAVFDNQYYLNLLSGEGLLVSDQVLAGGDESVRSAVEAYAEDPQIFFNDFSYSMVKMGALMPLTGGKGEIRRNCRTVNSLLI